MNVSNVKFYLKAPRSSKATAIFLRVQLNRKSVKYYIRESINPEYWDFENGRPINSKKLIKTLSRSNPTLEIQLGNLESKLSRIANKIVSFVSLKAHNGENVDAHQLRSELDNFLGISKQREEKLFIVDCLKNFISEIETGKRTTARGTRFALGTVKNYKGLLTILQDFESLSKDKLTFENFDINTFNAIKEWLQSKMLSLNTIGRHIKQLKAIFKYAHQEGIHDNSVYKDSRFKVYRIKSDEIYLTEEEIEKLRLLDLSNSPRLELVRDVFLLGCYTALRYSDYSRISPEHITKEVGKTPLLTIHNKKTDIKTKVPLRWEAIEILEKYDFKLPKTYEQKVNKGIKEIGRMASIDENIVAIKFKGKEKIREIKPKYLMIKTHTARRSAATNMYKAGISTVEIMSITGHKSEKTFFGYINVTNEEIVERLCNHSFFNTNGTDSRN